MNTMPHFASRFELPALPFERHSLEPEVSRAQIDLLYSHHHRRHIDELNVQLAPDDGRSLAALARAGEDEVRYPAQEAWNLVFFWHGLSGRSVEIPENLSRRIDAAFGGVGGLQYQWRARIQETSAGWCWLMLDSKSTLRLATSSPGELPDEMTPLLAITLTDEAYRIDHRHDRGEYFDALWPHLNWEYAQLNSEVAGRTPV
jgi:Fe-Mn family superoxide dismutase